MLRSGLRRRSSSGLRSGHRGSSRLGSGGRWILALAHEVRGVFHGSNIVAAPEIVILLLAMSKVLVLGGMRANVANAIANHVATAIIGAILTFCVDLRCAIPARIVQEVRIPICWR